MDLAYLHNGNAVGSSIIQHIKNSRVRNTVQPVKRMQVNPKLVRDQSLGSQLLDVREAMQKMASLSVVTYHIEQEVSLIKEFSCHLTKDEEKQLQFILQVVQAQWRA